MRNLRNAHRSVLWSPDGLHLTATGWDVATDSVICAFGPTKDNVLIKLKRWNASKTAPGEEILEHIASWDAPCPLPDLESDFILDLHHFSDSSTTCLVLAGGDIIVVRECPLQGEEKIEIVGSVDVGISAAAWSPDEELLAITTRADTLLYMTRNFENVADALLTSDDLKASKHVSVGWGKSETQFKGRGAKALRDPTMPEKVDEGVFSTVENGFTTISWRGDGTYVAVNSTQATTRRLIRVYSREGLLDGVSEPVDALEHALSWRPVGNLMASIQRLENRIDVVFFERNGLRHGQFPLRLSHEEIDSLAPISSLKWNVDSSVLAVSFKEKIQLWTMGNYHYYLKQEIPLLESALSPNTIFSWHPEQPLLFTVGSEAGIQRFEFVDSVVSGVTSPPNDYGIVAVIDGKILKLTPLRLANIPPPMSLHEVVVDSSINDAAIFTDKIQPHSTRIAIMSQRSITVYDWDLKTKPVATPVRLTSCVISTSTMAVSDPTLAPYNQQIVWMDKNRLLILTSEAEGSTIRLFSLEAGKLHLVKSVSRPFLQGLLVDVATTIPYHHTVDGQVIEDSELLQSQTNLNSTSSVAAMVFPKHTRKVELICTGYSDASRVDNADRNLTIGFGLALNGCLFANKRCLAKDCTSFLVTPDHIIFTTTQHLLKFVHMGLIEELEVPPDTPEIDERCRSIERGAKLVTVIPSISALVLQMPRGNLETIYPRALVLAVVRQNINTRKYKKAFLACRNNRVDMNIIHDHDPQAFIANAALFIEQVGKVEHIDLFLSQLREEDVSKLMYKETLPQRPKDSGLSQLEAKPGISKVNRVCDAFLSVLTKKTSSSMQNIITAHVCKNPPDLNGGLSQVAKLQKDDPALAETAVEHICFLADVNKLYDNALGLYDLDLVLLVAQQSQKDPREYLPFLQSLQELPLFRRQYTIDNHLGRYGKALKHLHDLNVFEELKSYVMKHNLHQEALHLYKYQENHVLAIMRLYADYLLKESKYNDAGIAYEYLKDYTSAYECYRLAHLWKESLSCAGLVPLEALQLRNLAQTIAESLIEQKNYSSAATIYTEYLNNIDGAAKLFCKGYFFADAIRVLSLYRHTEALETVVDVGLVEGMATMTELLADCKAQLNAQIPRVAELHIKKAEQPLLFYDGDANGGIDIPDNVSLAATDASTTGGSLFTRYTNRTGTVGTNASRKTSKNRMREERKRARGKKGSVYEEEYLINSIGRLIDRVNAVGDEVSRLIVGLMRRRMTERARAVEGAMMELVELCRGCVDDVFLSVGNAKVVELGVGGERPLGPEGVTWDSLEEAQPKREAPIVKRFERLALLGG